MVKGWQKPQKLINAIITKHMYQQDGNIIDGMCGTATASVVALRGGMNAYAFDHNMDQCKASLARLAHVGLATFIGPEEELYTKADWKLVIAGKAKSVPQIRPPADNDLDNTCEDLTQGERGELPHSLNEDPAPEAEDEEEQVTINEGANPYSADDVETPDPTAAVAETTAPPSAETSALAAAEITAPGAVETTVGEPSLAVVTGEIAVDAVADAALTEASRKRPAEPNVDEGPDATRKQKRTADETDAPLDPDLALQNTGDKSVYTPGYLATEEKKKQAEALKKKETPSRNRSRSGK